MSGLDLKAVKQKIIDQLKMIFDPEIPVNIYDLGLIYSIEVTLLENEYVCKIDMTLTSPTCPVGESLIEQVNYAANSLDEIDKCFVNLTFEPPWTLEMMSEGAKEQMAANGVFL